MALSVSPAACNLAIFSLAGLEKLHSSMAQVATVSLQPHWQPIWAATRRTSTLGFSAAVWARALGHAVRINSKNKSGSWRTRAGVVRAASLQFVRKITGFNKPSKSNEAVFLAAVDEIAGISARLLQALD